MAGNEKIDYSQRWMEMIEYTNGLYAGDPMSFHETFLKGKKNKSYAGSIVRYPCCKKCKWSCKS